MRGDIDEKGCPSYPFSTMRTLTLRLPDELARKLTARARSEKTTPAAVLRGVLADYLLAD